MDVADSSVPDTGIPKLARQQSVGVVKHNAHSGQAYISFVDGAHKAEKDERLHVMASHDEIEFKYGAGNRLYFNLLIFVIMTNAIIGLVGIVEWSIYLADPLRVPINGIFDWKDFFVSEFLRGRQSKAWFWCSTVMMILYLLLGFSYGIWERFVFRRRPKEHLMYVMKNPEQITDAIPVNIAMPRRQRYMWRVVSITCAVACFAAATGILYGIIVGENLLIRATFTNRTSLSRATLTSLVSILSGIALAILMLIWNPVCALLTRLERHKSWSRFRISMAAKLIGFRMMCLVVLFVLQAKVLVQYQPNDDCLFLDGGTKMTTILIVDILLMNLISLLQALLSVRVKRFIYTRRPQWKPEECDLDDEETLKSEFNLSDELLQIIYRQFVTYIGSMVFPLIAFICLLGAVFEYFFSRWLMLRLTQRPKYIEDALGVFLFVWLMIIAVCAFLFYPIGPLWILYLPQLLPVAYRNCSMVGAIRFA